MNSIATSRTNGSPGTANASPVSPASSPGWRRNQRHTTSSGSNFAPPWQRGIGRTGDSANGSGGLGLQVQNSTSFNAYVYKGHTPIENVDSSSSCCHAWEQLAFQSRESENLRLCDVCGSTVYYVETLEQVPAHLRLGHKYCVGPADGKYRDGVSKCCRQFGLKQTRERESRVIRI